MIVDKTYTSGQLRAIADALEGLEKARVKGVALDDVYSLDYGGLVVFRDSEVANKVAFPDRYVWQLKVDSR